jgi:tRNA (cytidine/uridine-2'-O-)-methyltransferase
MPKIALFQPEIALNVGSIIRSCACFGFELEIIEPCGFPFDMRRIRQSALDYIDLVKITRHNSFDEFRQKNPESRIIIATTKTDQDFRNFNFTESDIILFGQESKGLPAEIHEKADEKITIKMKNVARSLNLGVSAAVIMSRF